MDKTIKLYFQSVSVMIGCIIGVGMFGLPYLTQKSGVIPFLILIVVFGAIQLFIHLLYANLIIVTPTYHRLPGYARKYLGVSSGHLMFVTKVISDIGALLAYMIITGVFLHTLLSPYLGGSALMYSSVVFFFEAVVLYFGIGVLARAEVFMTAFLIFVISLISIKGLAAVDIDNYSFVNLNSVFLPYGAVLFAISGVSSIPIVVRLFRRNQERIKKAVIIGTYLSLLLIIIFTLSILGISGAETTPDALVGLNNVLGDGIITLLLIFGVLTMATSFLVIAEALKDTLQLDYSINKKIAWVIAVFVPYLLYLAGFQNFIKVISFAGGVAGGVIVILMLMIFKKIKDDKKKMILFKSRISDASIIVLMLAYFIGIVYEIFSFVNH